MTIFFRLLKTDDKGTALHQAIQQFAQEQPNFNTFAVEPESFQQVPGSPFAYWASEKVLHTFTSLKPFEGKSRMANPCFATSNDGRFLRNWWEPAPTRINTTQKGEEAFGLCECGRNAGKINR